MKIEISAGGVVYKKEKNQVKILLVKDQNGVWTFPKGLVQSAEDRKLAAQREVAEEAGISQLKLIVELKPIQYWYRFEGELIKKTVYYYLFETTGKETPKPQIEEGISAARWFALPQAQKSVGYRQTNEKVLQEALNYLP